MITQRNSAGITRLSSGAIPSYRIVKPHSDDNTVIVATSGAAPLQGVSGPENASATGQRLAIEEDGVGIVPVEYGETIAFGQPLTAGAAGRAFVADVGDYIIGYANEDGVVDEIGSVRVAIQQLGGATGATGPQGPAGPQGPQGAAG